MECDKGSPAGQPENKGAGSIDRIDGPGERAFANFFAIFLAENAVIGVVLVDELADRGFRPPVGFGDRVKSRMTSCSPLPDRCEREG